MSSKLKNFKKIKYSSLLQIIIINEILIIQGPLGTLYYKVPSPVKIIVNQGDNFLYITLNVVFFLKKERSYIQTVTSILMSSCCSVIFGNLVFLELEGLGFKFISTDRFFKKENFTKLEMSIGYSDNILHFSNNFRSQIHIKNPRKIFLYSCDYSFIQNESSMILNLKKPDKYKKKGFIIKKI